MSKSSKQERTVRINEQIRCPKVRLIKDSENLGIVDTYKAKKIAISEGLDLVEVSNNDKIPVCAIMDYGKYKYEKQKKIKKNKDTSSVVKVKEIQLSPVIGYGDLVVKANKAKSFLADGMKVQITLRFKKRQNAHKEVGFEVIQKFLEELKDVALVDMPAKLQGNCIRCRIEQTKQNKG